MKIKTKFYNGEETNPFPKEMDEHYFWEIESEGGKAILDMDMTESDIKRATSVLKLLCDPEGPPPEMNVTGMDFALLPIFYDVFIETQQRYARKNPVTRKPFDYSKYST